MRRARRFSICLIVALVATAAAAVPAAAAKPTTERSAFPLSFIDEDLCSFDVVVNLGARISETTYYNSAGEPVRVQTHYNFTGTSANADTGKTLRTHHSYTEILDLVSGTLSFIGLPFGTWFTSGGIAIRDAGIAVIDLGTGDVVHQGGPHPFAEGGFLPQLCPLLS